MLKQLAKLRDPATLLKQRDKINDQIREWIKLLTDANYSPANRTKFLAKIQPLISKLQKKYPTASGSTIIAEVLADPSMAEWTTDLKVTTEVASVGTPNSKPSSTAGTAAEKAKKRAKEKTGPMGKV